MATRSEHAGRIVHRIADLVPNQRCEEWFEHLLHDAESFVPGWTDRATAYVRGLWAAGVIDTAKMLSLEEDINNDGNRPFGDDFQTSEAVRNLCTAAYAKLNAARETLGQIEDPEIRQEADGLLAMVS